MTDTTDLAGDPDAGTKDNTGGPATPPGDRGVRPSRVPKLGIWAWSFVGFVAAIIILFIGFAAVSEIALPLVFAAVLAVVFKPLANYLQRHRIKPTLAAGLVVLGLIALMVVVLVATVRGVTDQIGQIDLVTDEAIENAGDQLGVSEADLEAARAAVEEASPTIAEGVLTHLVAGVGSLIGLVSGLILGALIMYYLLKDGAKFQLAIVERSNPTIRADVNAFIDDACRILRDYGQGRSVMSAIVAVVIGVASLLLGLPLVFTIMVVNFIGGYIPYIGAFLGGGLAVIVALGDGGLGAAVIMLVVVLASNLLLENFVEPKVMGKSLDIHPMIVLIVTALGGLLGGIVGLILAVPVYVIARDAIDRFRSRGVVDMVADRAQPTVQRLLE
jgi:putative heme transporter